MLKPLLGIALGGGGARGAAHVGVLQEFDNAGIDICLLYTSDAADDTP